MAVLGGARRRNSSIIKNTPDSIEKALSSSHFYQGDKLDIEKVILDAGIKIQWDCLESEISGKIERKHNDWTITVNKLHHPNRQRYTLAHEFAHYCLHRNLQNNFQDTTFFRKEGNMDNLEYEANRLAASILMPEEKVRDTINKGEIKTLQEIADAFGVSMIAMKYRLNNLGYKLIYDGE